MIKIFKKLFGFLPLLALPIVLYYLNLGVARRGLTENHKILHYQLSKLPGKERVTKIVFLGDSSCGNAINAKVFSKLASKETLNLCLTASYGLGSQIHFFDFLSSRFTEVQSYVFMYSPYSLGRNPPRDGEFLVLLSLRDWRRFLKNLDFFILRKLVSVKSLWNTFQGGGASLRFVEAAEGIDYLRQMETRNIRRGKLGLTEDFKKHLKTLGQACCLEEKKCFFVFGPALTELTADFVKSVRASLSSQSCFRLIEDVPAMDESMFGDSAEHVRPIDKSQITRDYYNILKSHL